NAIANFEAALDDDLNTPAALGVLFPFVREANACLDSISTPNPGDLQAARDALDRMDDVLGILELARRDSARGVDPELQRWIEDLIDQRQQARGRRDFKAADEIRDRLAAA